MDQTTATKPTLPRARRHRRAIALVAAAAVVGAAALTGCTPLGKPAVRQTPVTSRVFDNSDPAVLVVGSTTYLFGSTNNKKVPVREVRSFSGSLDASKTEWDSMAAPASKADAMPTRPAWAAISNGAWEIWAPSPIKIGTTYYLYFAARRSGASNTHNDQCIGRASSATPAGPYTPSSSPLYCGLPKEAGSNSWGRGALDPEVLRGADGKLYMLVSLSRTEDPIGVVPLTSTGLVSGGVNAKATVLVGRTQPWQDGSDNSTLVHAGTGTLENPSMIYEPKTKTYLLFYSAGDWRTPYYNTGFARCATPTGPCTAQTDGPFLKSGSGRTGIGGLTAFRTADGVARVAYASWQAGSENKPSPDGKLSRRTHWSRLLVTNTSDAGSQSVRLAE